MAALYSCTLPVRIGDINYGGHLGNDKILLYAHEARLQMLQSKGFSEMDCGGHSLIMADAEVSFRAELFQGDIITVTLFAGDAGPKGFSLYYQFRATRGETDFLAAEVRTGLVAFDYTARCVCPLSGDFCSRMGL